MFNHAVEIYKLGGTSVTNHRTTKVAPGDRRLFSMSTVPTSSCGSEVQKVAGGQTPPALHSTCAERESPEHLNQRRTVK